jgi:predicted DNA-binding transcriptional regulator YafY
MRANKGGNRPSIERMRTLAVLLRTRTHFTTTEVAQRFETTRKTISRDLAFLRDRLGYDFEYDAQTKRWNLKIAPTPML